MPKGVYQRPLLAPLTERVWAKVDKRGPDECWPWQGHIMKSGHGKLYRNDVGTTLAHRIVYELLHGPVDPSLMVCHRCNNARCCNPTHLYVGTAQDNIDDRTRAGHHGLHLHPEAAARGERNGMAKLSAADVEAIRSQRGKRFQREIAAEYGVSRSLISMIWNGVLWKDKVA